MFWKLAVRDVAVLGLCVAIWPLYSRLSDASIVVLVALAAVAILATVWVAYSVHEWGHLAGAAATGSVVYPGQRLTEVFLFHFDGHKNTNRQFVGMSIGGFIGSLLVLAVLLMALPLATWPAKITLGLVVIGIMATAYLEVPQAWRVHRGAALPSGPVFEPFPSA